MCRQRGCTTLSLQDVHLSHCTWYVVLIITWILQSACKLTGGVHEMSSYTSYLSNASSFTLDEGNSDLGDDVKGDVSNRFLQGEPTTMFFSFRFPLFLFDDKGDRTIFTR